MKIINIIKVKKKTYETIKYNTETNSTQLNDTKW